MSDKVDKILSKLEKIYRLSGEVVGYLIDNPHCLDDQPEEKKEAYYQAIAYFESKRRMSQCDDTKFPNRRISILLSIGIESWREASSESEEELAEEAKISKLVLETNTAELKRVPEDIKAIAFKIIRYYLTEMGDLYS